MKKFLCLLLTLINLSVFACYVVQPRALENNQKLLQFDDGNYTSSVIVFVPNINITKYNLTITNNHITSWVNTNSYDDSYYKSIGVSQDCTIMAYPITIDVEFNGFFDNNGQQIQNVKITRACALYFNKQNNTWTILKDITNPKQNIISNTGEGKSLFGKYILTYQTGFGANEIIFLTFYFQGKDNNNNVYKTHSDFNTLITTPPHLLNTPNKYRVLKIGLTDNIKPI